MAKIDLPDARALVTEVEHRMVRFPLSLDARATQVLGQRVELYLRELIAQVHDMREIVSTMSAPIQVNEDGYAFCVDCMTAFDGEQARKPNDPAAHANDCQYAALLRLAVGE